MFTSSIPNRYWEEAILTASYLINRLPSKVLNYQTPLHNLMKIFPHARILSSLSPKAFGCIVYVHHTSPNRHKLEPKPLKCIFIGYSPTQKGYKCYYPLSQKFFVFCDVTFVENEFYYPSTSFQREKSHWDPTVSMPISLPGVSHPSNTDMIQTATADHPQAATFEQPELASIDSTTSPNPSPVHQPIQLAELVMTSIGGGLYSEKPTKVYSRKPKCPAPQLSQLLKQENGPTSEEHTGANSDLDIPITIRKGVRFCVKCPISNYLTHSRLSSQFKAFTTTVDAMVVPQNIQEALNDPKWKEAVMEEIKAHIGNHTWDIVEYPKDKKIVGCKWVFIVKYRSDESIDRYKARLVA